MQVGLLFGSSIIIARQLGPANRAVYALPLALVGIVWAVCHLSFDRGLLRLIGRREATIGQAVTASIGFGVMVSIVGPVVAIGIGVAWPGIVGGATMTTVVLAALGLPGIHFTYAAGDLLLVVGKRRSWTAAVTGGCISQLVLVVIAAATHNLTVHVALATAAISNTITALLLLGALVRGSAVARPSSALMPVARRSLAVGLRLHPGSLSLVTASRFSLLIVGAMVSLQDTGYYSLAVSLAEAAYAGVIALGSARLQRQTELELDGAVEYTYASARTLFLASAGFCLVAAIASYPLILIAFGHDWLPAVKLVVILVLARAVVAPEELFRTLLERIAPPWYASAASVGALVVGLIFTAGLTAAFGVTGGAVASAIGYGTYGVALWGLLRRARRM